MQRDPWGVLLNSRVRGRRTKNSRFTPWRDHRDAVYWDEGVAEWITIHPSPRTRIFKEMLLGEYGYTDGQGIYNSVRSTETALRQIQATMLTKTLDTVKYSGLKRDWEKHAIARELDAEAIALKYGMVSNEVEAVTVAKRAFETWRQTLETTLLDMIRELASCFSIGEPNGAANFSQYIEWICCLGMVPMVRTEQLVDLDTAMKYFREIGSVDVDEPIRMEAVLELLKEGRKVASYILLKLQSVKIMEYDRAIIEYNFLKRQVRVKDAVTGLKGECLILWRPLMKNGTVVYDSPLQRLYHEVMACHALRRHVDICRLVNTAPVKVVIGKKSDDERGTAGARKIVEKALGEDVEESSGSAAARLLRLMINMKGMKHVGNITDVVKDYLEETCSHLLGAPAVDTTQPGFGRGGRAMNQRPRHAFTTTPATLSTDCFQSGQQPGVKEAFQTSIINNINTMLEGYVNKLFNTVEDLKSVNEEMAKSVKRKDEELWRLRKEVLAARQSEADISAELQSRSNYGLNWPGSETSHDIVRMSELGRDVIDVSGLMSDDCYVANTFQSRYIPSYEDDLKRLSALWEQEMLRSFKLTRIANNQGQETSVSYSNSAITLLLAPFFYSILKMDNLGPLINNVEAYQSEEELCTTIFRKSRVDVYLDDLLTLYIADVKRHVTTHTVLYNKHKRAISELDTAMDDKTDTEWAGQSLLSHNGISPFSPMMLRTSSYIDTACSNDTDCVDASRSGITVDNQTSIYDRRSITPSGSSACIHKHGNRGLSEGRRLCDKGRYLDACLNQNFHNEGITNFGRCNERYFYHNANGKCNCRDRRWHCYKRPEFKRCVR